MSSELVDTETGEVITEADARASVARARYHGRISFAEITWQVEHRVWELLGYDSWNAMRDTEYADLRAVVPKADRPELTGRMRAAGLTQQQIADTLGVSKPTVHRDLEAHVANGTSEPTKIKNARGQERPASYQRNPRPLPKPEPSPERAKINNARIDAERLANSLGMLSEYTQTETGRRRAITAWQIGSDGASPPARQDVTPEHMRSLAEGLRQLADEWTQP